MKNTVNNCGCGIPEKPHGHEYHDIETELEKHGCGREGCECHPKMCDKCVIPSAGFQTYHKVDCDCSCHKTEKMGVGFLRQWLNEDRITDPKKMVTNEELLVWIDDVTQKPLQVVTSKPIEQDSTPPDHVVEANKMVAPKCHKCGVRLISIKDGCFCVAAQDFNDRFTGVMKELADEEAYKSHFHCWEQKQPPACGIKTYHLRCCLCPTTQKPLQEGGVGEPQSGHGAEAHTSNPTTPSINEIIKEFRSMLKNQGWPVEEPDARTRWLRTTLSSFEANIRADEADMCENHIKMARQSIYKELIDAIEGEKLRLETESEWLDTRLMKGDWEEGDMWEAVIAVCGDVKGDDDIVNQITEHCGGIATLEKAAQIIKQKQEGI